MPTRDRFLVAIEAATIAVGLRVLLTATNLSDFIVSVLMIFLAAFVIAGTGNK